MGPGVVFANPTHGPPSCMTRGSPPTLPGVTADRPARVKDVHELALGLPHVTVVHGPRGNVVYQVGGRSFVFFRTPRPDVVDAATGERLPDVIVFWVEPEADKQALVQDETTPFFTTPHFDGHDSVLVQASRLGEPALSRRSCSRPGHTTARCSDRRRRPRHVAQHGSGRRDGPRGCARAAGLPRVRDDRHEGSRGLRTAPPPTHRLDPRADPSTRPGAETAARGAHMVLDRFGPRILLSNYRPLITCPGSLKRRISCGPTPTGSADETTRRPRTSKACTPPSICESGTARPNQAEPAPLDLPGQDRGERWSRWRRRTWGPVSP